MLQNAGAQNIYVSDGVNTFKKTRNTLICMSVSCRILSGSLSMQRSGYGREPLYRYMLSICHESRVFLDNLKC